MDELLIGYFLGIVIPIVFLIFFEYVPDRKGELK